MPRTLLIRADASTSVGMGHAMRCLALGQAWQDAGGSVAFRLTNVLPALESRLRVEGMTVLAPAGDVDSQSDAVATAKAASALGAEWVVIDGYGFDAAYNDAVRDAGVRVLCVDDNAHLARYAADIVLNQNACAREAMYADLAPSARVLAGSAFAMLRREFVGELAPVRETPDIARHVLVTFGGSDPLGLTGAVLGVLADLHMPLEIVAVTGLGNPRYAEVVEIASAIEGCRVESAVDDMRGLMMWADVALSAGGSTMWEMCYLGLPFAALAVAENQRDSVRFVANRGIAVDLGDPSKLGSTSARAAVRGLLENPEARRQQGHGGQALIDGGGARRVVDAVMQHMDGTEAR